MALSEFITENMEPILAEWEGFARSLRPGVSMLPRALRDHAELMLSAMAADMLSSQTESQRHTKAHGDQPRDARAADTAAEKHGSGRFTEGFDINEMVAEYRALRASVIRLWTRDLGRASRTDLDELVRFNEAIDQAITESVLHFSAVRDRSRELGEARRLNAELERSVAETKAALQVRESRYRLLFEALDDGFCTIEVRLDADQHAVDYRFLEANPAFERQTGLRRVTGQCLHELAPAHEPGWLEHCGQVALTGESRRFEHSAAEPELRWFDVHSFRIGEPQQRRVGILLRDITVTRRAEAVLREESQRKDEFLATLGHELRNPLAPIRNGLQILKLAAAGDPTLLRVSGMMERQMRHLVRLVDDLLDVSRISSGKVALRKQRARLDEALEAAVESTAASIEGKCHTLLMEVTPEPMVVAGDPERLTQIFANLLSNAAKYTPVGGEIRLSLERQGEEAVVNVRDSGVGIAREALERVFDMFAQIVPHDAREGGLGIGLALVRQLVDLHGGGVSAHSEGPGLGTTFTVRLPLAAAPCAVAGVALD